jgi:hypothetical protein
MAAFRTLKVFVMGQDPRSLKSIELLNWTGLAFVGKRSQIAQARDRKELQEPGVYMLIGDDDAASGLVDIYVGETDDFAKRINDHVSKKYWWDTFVVFVSKDRYLTKAHVRWLEKALYHSAKAAVGTLNVRNDKEPNGAALPESDEHAMQEFYQNLIFVLETMGHTYFDAVARPEIVHDGSDVAKFQMTLPKEIGKGDLKGYLEVREGSFILLKGSYIRAQVQESFQTANSGYFTLWAKITASDAVRKTDVDGALQTTRDIEFKSVSAAGAIVRGRTTNGKTDWKRVADGKPYAECFAED